MVWSTPLKMNMEPKHEGLVQMISHCKETGEFRVQNVNFRGCSDLHPFQN